MTRVLRNVASVVATGMLLLPDAHAQSTNTEPVETEQVPQPAAAQLPALEVIGKKKVSKPKTAQKAKVKPSPTAATSGGGAQTDVFPEGVTTVAATVEGPFSAQEMAVYTSSGSSAYISGETLQRFSGTSPSDVLRGIPGVTIGETRNGGGIDANIRGLQGQRRVSVTVDGAENTIDTYRGYAGSQQRSYLDPDLLSDMTVSKGPSASQGAIAGTIAATTLKPEDILKPGRSMGVRVKGDIASNSTKEPTEFHATPETNYPGLFDSDAANGSIAFAMREQYFDIVAAYAERDQGNYFAGKRGTDDYRRYVVRFRPGGPRLEETISVATLYGAGNEVLNSSVETQSLLLKATARFAEDQSLELGYRKFDSVMGEIMPSQILRNSTGTIPQWRPGYYETDTFTAKYKWAPKDNPLINLRVGGYYTEVYTDAFNNPADNAPVPPGSPMNEFTDPGYRFLYGAKMDLKRSGLDIANTSRLKNSLGAFALDYGASLSIEDLSPAAGSYQPTQDDLNNNKYFRSAVRGERNSFVNLSWQPAEPVTLDAGVRYSEFAMRDRNRLARRVGSGLVFDDPIERDDDGFAKTASAKLEVFDDTHIYAQYAEGIRMPGIYETTLGYNNATPEIELKPEEAKNWEFGASTIQHAVFSSSDTAMLKFAYFDNDVKNFISRHAPYNTFLFQWQNNDSFRVKGLEAQAAYDAGLFFADGSLTYNFEAVTCNASLAADARRQANDVIETLASMNIPPDPSLLAMAQHPNCLDGGFLGSFTNIQNPPKVSANLTLGVRLFDERLTLGGRVLYFSKPLAELDTVWHINGDQAVQLYNVGPIATLDLFSSYKFSEDAVMSFGVDNVFDRYYMDPIAVSYMPAPGRTFKAGFTAKF